MPDIPENPDQSESAERAGGGRGRLHEIRKYPNRRYYDTTSRRHMALEELRTLVVDGAEIRVTDSRTGEDITAAVLTQIILKLDAPKLQVFPVSLLHRLVRANENLVKDFVENYFERTLTYFLDAQRQFGDELNKRFGVLNLPQWPVDWTRLASPPALFGPPASSDASEAARAAPEAPSREPAEGFEERLEELQAQIRDLQLALDAARAESRQESPQPTVETPPKD